MHIARLFLRQIKVTLSDAFCPSWTGVAGGATHQITVHQINSARTGGSWVNDPHSAALMSPKQSLSLSHSLSRPQSSQASLLRMSSSRCKTETKLPYLVPRHSGLTRHWWAHALPPQCITLFARTSVGCFFVNKPCKQTPKYFLMTAPPQTAIRTMWPPVPASKHRRN